MVFSGGGVKGLTYVGVLKYFQEHKGEGDCVLSNIKEYIGCSIGAFTALMFLLGYKNNELEEIIDKINFKRLVDYKISNFFETYGLEQGKKIENFIKIFIKTKGFKEDITFKELYEKIPKKLVIITTNLNINGTEYFSVDTYPDTPVYLAIKMSMCVPIFFQPVKYNNCYYVDGGITCNFPVRYFDNHTDVVNNIDNTDSKILAFSFNKNKKDYKITSFYSYIYNIVYSVFFTVENIEITRAKNKKVNIVLIDTCMNSDENLKLDISLEAKKNLYNIGYTSVKNFMEKK